MADWTNITDSVLEPGKPIRSVDALAFRDNPIAIAERATGAPRVKVASIELLTTSGTFTVPDGVSRIKVTVIGGGGGSDNNDGGAGGSGGVSIKFIDTEPGTEFSYSIGGGGSIRSAGGTTSFSNECQATGGGAGSNGNGGLGGIGSGGSVNINTTDGGDGRQGTGGSNLFGGGGTTGDPGNLYGGGGGSGSGVGIDSTPGQAGANGAIIVEY